MTNQGRTRTWIILIVIAVVLFLLLMPLAAPKDKNFMEVRLYDKDGNLITTSETFSIVNGVVGVASFDITINVKNTGAQTLSCTPNTITPTQFDSALTKTTLNVLAGNTISWTSVRMAAPQFEAAPTPDVFSASVTCTWTGSPITKSGTISLTIQPDATGANFEITLSPGGLGTEFCGDGTCQSSETPASCPADCTVSTRVKFRTTDLQYVSGSAIGYTATCGSTLTAYGYDGMGTSIGYNCDRLISEAPTMCGGGAVQYLFNIPGAIAGYAQPVKLYKGTSDLTLICVCANEVDGGGYRYMYYDSNDLDAGKVNPQATSIDTAKEVAC